MRTGRRIRFVDSVCSFVDDADFEAKHDRDESGRFSSGGSGESYAPTEEMPPDFDAEKFKELIGPEFKGVRRQAAVQKLINERRGHVKGAFHRKDIGDIDLIWGNDVIGLCHILKRREVQGISPEDFAKDLTEVVQNGDLCQSKGKCEIWYKKKMVVVSTMFHGKAATFIITSFPSRKRPARFKRQA